MKSELRKDYIQEKYVIIAPRRGKRPHDVGKSHDHATTKTECVFCPETLQRNKIKTVLTVGGKRNWNIAVIPNKFPAVSPANPKAYGRQEVIIEAPKHEPEIEDLSDRHVADILKVYADRTRAISQDKRIEYILIFKNEGGAAGASLMHAHSQIFATEFLPPHLHDKSARVLEYKLKHGSCVYCDVLKKERHSPRFVAENQHVIAFTPYASLHNYEIWIVPKRHLDNVTLLTPAERLSFAKMLKRLLRKINGLGLPYNYYFHQVIRDEDQHLYMKITPRGSVWAGVEIGSGLIINPIAPEEAAKFYKSK